MRTSAKLPWAIALTAATGFGQIASPLLLDTAGLVPEPTEVTGKSGAKMPAGTVETIDGRSGKALLFNFVESAGPQFFTARIGPDENRDACDGFSFWVKGDGSKNCAGLELIDDSDFSLRYGYCFSITNTDWVRITVPWRDLMPELAGPPVDAKNGYAPSRFRNLWFGKWFYWREFPACSYAIEQMVLEKHIAGANADYTPQLPDPARFLAKLEAGQPVTIVTMGDSLSDKRHWANRDRLWSELLAEELKTAYGSQVTLVNPALGGTTLSQNAVLMPRWLQDAPAPDLVTIWFGYNDWDSGVRGDRFAAHLRLTVDRLRRETKGAADVLLLTTCPCHDRWDAMNEMAEAVRKIAREKKTGLADVAAQFHKVSADEAVRQNYLAWDKVHLGAKGHEVTSDTVRQAIAGAK